MRNHIAIVPARAGSQSITNKNLVPLGGKPLVYHTLKAACDSGLFEKVILSTDIPTLLDETQTPWVLQRRNPEMASNDALMIHVVRDVLSRSIGFDDTWIWLLQPTSPFRTLEDFNEIASLLRTEKKSKALISVTAVGDHNALRQYFKSPEGCLRRVISKPKVDAFCPRQKLQPTFERNGLFYVIRARWLREFDHFDPHPCLGFEIPEERSRNINTPHDLALARVEAEMLRQGRTWS